LPLRLILEAAPDRPDLVARLLVDDGTFTITSTAEAIRVEYGDTSSEPELVARTNYEGFLEAGEGRISLEEIRHTAPRDRRRRHPRGCISHTDERSHDQARVNQTPDE
jgi:hypothetical protein